MIALCTFFCLLVFTWRDVPMHPAMTYESLPAGRFVALKHFFCCWERRYLRDGLLGDSDENIVRESQLRDLEKFSKSVENRKLIERKVRVKLELQSKWYDGKMNVPFKQSKLISTNSEKISNKKNTSLRKKQVKSDLP